MLRNCSCYEFFPFSFLGDNKKNVLRSHQRPYGLNLPSVIIVNHSRSHTQNRDPPISRIFYLCVCGCSITVSFTKLRSNSSISFYPENLSTRAALFCSYFISIPIHRQKNLQTHTHTHTYNNIYIDAHTHTTNRISRFSAYIFGYIDIRI